MMNIIVNIYDLCEAQNIDRILIYSQHSISGNPMSGQCVRKEDPLDENKFTWVRASFTVSLRDKVHVVATTNSYVNMLLRQHLAKSIRIVDGTLEVRM